MLLRCDACGWLQPSRDDPAFGSVGAGADPVDPGDPCPVSKATFPDACGFAFSPSGSVPGRMLPPPPGWAAPLEAALLAGGQDAAQALRRALADAEAPCS